MMTPLTKFKPFLFALLGFFAALGALSVTHIGPAQAQSPGGSLAALVAKVNTLQSKLSADEATITSQGDTITSQGSTITSLQSSLGGVQSKQTADEGGIGKLQTLTAPLSLSGDPGAGGTNTLLTITGVNVQIVNGLGGSDTRNGLGNLIVGYNEKGNDLGAVVRTGSHNIVTGALNSYASSGGILGGYSNTLSGFGGFAVGADNFAKGDTASVSGGVFNFVSGESASVSGGELNTATGAWASVSGGYGNTASGSYASVSGGRNNTASGSYASVSGGRNNTASGEEASVSGGYKLTEGTKLGWKAGSESGTSFGGNFASP